MAVEQTRALVDAALEAAADHGPDQRPRPPLIRPAVRAWTLGQLYCRLGERGLAQPGQRGRTRRARFGSCAPRVPSTRRDDALIPEGS